MFQAKARQEVRSRRPSQFSSSPSIRIFFQAILHVFGYCPRMRKDNLDPGALRGTQQDNWLKSSRLNE